MPQPPVVETILRSRGAVLELIAAAVILALGVNLLATAVADFFGTSKQAMFWTSLVLVIASLALIVRRAISSRIVSRDYEAFLCYHRKDNCLIEVPEYEFSEDVSGYFRGLFAENEAPKKLWESGPLSNMFEYNEQSGVFKRRPTEAQQLVIEAIEYLLLDRLSTHLQDYFNKPGLDRERLNTLTREDIPGVVFKNRFLDTFSRPMQDRAAFVERTSRQNVPIGEIVASYGPEGQRYGRFTLSLPANAKVQRITPTEIRIDTGKFRLKLEIVFSGLNTNLPKNFERLYLNSVKFRDITTFSIQVKAMVIFKPLALLSQSGWQYHLWLDSFLTTLEKRISKKEFFERIKWDQALTVGRVVQATLSLETTPSHAKPSAPSVDEA